MNGVPHSVLPFIHGTFFGGEFSFPACHASAFEAGFTVKELACFTYFHAPIPFEVGHQNSLTSGGGFNDSLCGVSGVGEDGGRSDNDPFNGGSDATEGVSWESGHRATVTVPVRVGLVPVLIP